MIVRISAGISERCGKCGVKILADSLVCFLTSAMLKRCADCAGLTKAQQDKHYSDIVVSGEREQCTTPKRTFSFRKAAIMAMDTLPIEVRKRHAAALMEREDS